MSYALGVTMLTLASREQLHRGPGTMAKLQRIVRWASAEQMCSFWPQGQRPLRNDLGGERQWTKSMS